MAERVRQVCRAFAHVQQTGKGLVSRGSERFPICIETFGEISFVVVASAGLRFDDR